MLFTITNINIKLTVCGGVDFLKLINEYTVPDKNAKAGEALSDGRSGATSEAPWRLVAKTHPEIHTRALRLRLDGLFDTNSTAG